MIADGKITILERTLLSRALEGLHGDLVDSLVACAPRPDMPSVEPYIIARWNAEISVVLELYREVCALVTVEESPK